MKIVRWGPISELAGLRRAMEGVFEDTLPVRWRDGDGAELTFPVDLYDAGDEVVVKAVLPGIKAEDVEITVDGDSLTIRGETKHEEKVEKENYFRQEIRYGAFSRIIALPAGVRAEEAEAEFKDGLLRVRLPKAEEARAKTIKVRSGEPAGVR